MRSVAFIGAALAVAACATAPVAESAIWKPRPGLTFQIQLQGRIDTSVRAQVYDVDGEYTSQAVLRRLKRRGVRLVCYFSAGTYEDFRADSEGFPPSTRGKTLEGWPNERWLDVRAIEELRPVIEARMDTCRRKGFDAVDPDNVDGYTQDSGFPITFDDQLRFNRFLAREAHERGLAVGLKNDLGQVPQLVRDFDFQVNEQCFQFNECRTLLPFIRRRKAVFNIEYRKRPRQFCPTARRYRFSSVFKRLDLKAFRIAC